MYIVIRTCSQVFRALFGQSFDLVVLTNKLMNGSTQTLKNSA